MKRSLLNGARAGALVTAVVLAGGFAASAQAQGHTGHTGQPPPQQQTGHTGHGQMSDMPYDLHYIDMTIMHHEQGIEMARLAEEKGQSARVKAFAGKTAGDQQKDIEELRGHREHWYAGRPQMDHAQMMEHMKSMPMHKGMKMDPEADMAKLRAAEGREFDRLFLDTMTMHHRMAIMMSKEAQQKAEHAELKEFARKAVAKQTAETAEMKRIKASLGGATARKPAAKPKKPAPKKATHSGHTNH